MEPNNLKEKMDIFSGLNSIEKMIRNLEKGTVESIKKLNPFMQMFFDSKLGSEIENNAIISMSDAYYSIIVEVTSGLGLSLEKAQTLGSSIAHTISYTMGIAKLIDKYFRGEISEDLYYSELSKRLAVGAVTLINKNWNTLGNILSGGLRGVLVFFGVDPMTVESCISLASRVGTLIKPRISTFLNSEKVQRFIEKGLRTAGKAFKVLTDVATKAVETSKKAIKETKKFIEEVAEKVEVGFDKFCKSVKNGWIVVKNKTEEIGRRLKSWVSKVLS